MSVNRQWVLQSASQRLPSKTNLVAISNPLRGAVIPKSVHVFSENVVWGLSLQVPDFKPM